MNLKFNWGWGITIVLGLYMTMIMSLVVGSIRQPVDLVAPDYYAREIRYEETLNKLRNTNALPVRPNVSLTHTGDRVLIKLPHSLAKDAGEVLFMRPSDLNLDFKLPLETDADGQLFLARNKLTPGKWKVELEWQHEGTPYRYEQSLYLPLTP